MKTRLIIVDISSFIFRAFFAIRLLHAPDGTPVNAVRGVLSMLLKLLSKYQPTHIMLAKDTSDGSFRNEMYTEYKANRSEPPEELVPQFSLIEELVNKMNLSNIAFKEYEADDIIGSACVQWKDKFDEILIASGDKDLMQFVGDNIKMLDTMKDTIYDAKGVEDKMGVRPDQIVDYLSIVGDTSDNIPGMKGIGAKGAAELLKTYDTLENCIQNIDQLKGKRLINAFENHLEDGLLSKQLVQIKTDIELGVEAEETKWRFHATPELIKFLKDLDFKTAVKQVQDIEYAHAKAADNDENGEFKIVGGTGSDWETNLVTKDNFEEILKKLASFEMLAFYTHYDSSDHHAREIYGVSVSAEERIGYYFPFKSADQTLDQSQLKTLLKIFWEDQNKVLITDHAKNDFSYSFLHGFDISAKLNDLGQIHYIIDQNTRHDLATLCLSYLDHTLAVLPKGEAPIWEQNVENILTLCAEKACASFLLDKELVRHLMEYDLKEIYDSIDYPMLAILAKMENEGIMLNADFLKTLSKDFTKQLNKIEQEINEVSGHPINLKSPKQVGELLFDVLKLPVIKNTKTGYSTDSEVLQELESRDLSPIPKMILNYRELDKILSTYVNALPELLNPKTKRIHTTFHLNVAATGRLSSVHPNLQNIPVRTENGKKIRKAFIAVPGKLLLSADYSQMELRLLAHFSQDKTMIDAFLHGKDIHRQTASEVNGVKLEDVTDEERSKAKAVNFGLMYGQSSFGLAKALRISRKEAKDYITKYFERFSSIKQFLDSLKEECEKTGYAITLNGRKRFIPDIHSQNRTMKANAERVAINSPIQGTASDIIKLAMIDIDREITLNNLQSRMLLQVHDELIFSVPEEEIEIMKKIVKEKMENVVDLKVPISVDMGIGVNWYDLK